jgi:hypothetical protein
MKTEATLIWNGDKVKVQGKKVTGKTAFELGLIVEGQAKLLCPIDYGYLAASITVQSVSMGTEMETPKPNASKPKSYPHNVSTFKKIDKPIDPNEVLVGTAVDYAPYVEFGTLRSDAQPFLRPALDMAKGKTLTILLYNGKTYFVEYLQ